MTRTLSRSCRSTRDETVRSASAASVWYPSEDCGGPRAFQEVRQHYSAFRIAQRLVVLLKPITSGAGQEAHKGDGDGDDDHSQERNARLWATFPDTGLGPVSGVRTQGELIA